MVSFTRQLHVFLSGGGVWKRGSIHYLLLLLLLSVTAASFLPTDAIYHYSNGTLTVTGPRETASIFATYPAPYLSLSNGFLDQVRLTIPRALNTTLRSSSLWSSHSQGTAGYVLSLKQECSVVDLSFLSTRYSLGDAGLAMRACRHRHPPPPEDRRKCARLLQSLGQGLKQRALEGGAHATFFVHLSREAGLAAHLQPHPALPESHCQVTHSV